MADPEEIAASAGLRYLGDERPGIRRRRRGRGFSYDDERKRAVTAAQRGRIRALAIPPAWEEVWIAPEADAHLVATGIDAAGRKQYLYHPEWRRAADDAKFARLPEFASRLARLRARIRADLRSTADDLDHVCAAALGLIDESLIRPGSRRHLRDNESVGATTLRATEVEVGSRRIVLDFVGKGGVDQHVVVHDRTLARVLGQLVDDDDDTGFVFATPDGAAVDERMLNRYVERVGGTGFSVKDFRTWGATSIATGALATALVDGPELAERELARSITSAVEVAAEALGNTPTVARASYVDPRVLAAYADGSLRRTWRSTRAGKWLDRAERTTQRVLGT